MNVYAELKAIVESIGIPCGALSMSETPATYAVLRMPTHQEELAGDDQTTLYGAYMQIDLFTTADADTKATAVINAAIGAGYSYRGRSDDYLNDRQHVTIRLMKLEVNNIV